MTLQGKTGRGDDTGTLNKRTHGSLKFSFVSYGTEKTKEPVHSNKEVCQDLENKNPAK